jgi:mono/diheme cytochrome c family protein
LLRTLREGIEGTSMPSFRLLADDDLEALASYVIHLSMRGEIEYQVMAAVLKDQIEGNFEKAIREDYVSLVISNWQAAQTSMITPGPFPEFKTEAEREKYLQASIQRGFGMFSRPGPEGNQKSAGCLGCHADFGRQSAHKYDTWGTIVRPTDLTIGMYRGGRRPLDLYWRIHSGVNGVTMPASSSNLTPEEIWDIVNFLQVLPYPKMLEKYGVKLEGAK